MSNSHTAGAQNVLRRVQTESSVWTNWSIAVRRDSHQVSACEEDTLVVDSVYGWNAQPSAGMRLEGPHLYITFEQSALSIQLVSKQVRRRKSSRDFQAGAGCGSDSTHS